MKASIRVRVPATTANLGPGFDTLGIALKIYNEVELRLSPLTSHLSTPTPRPSALSMTEEAARLFFRKSGLKPRGFEARIHGNVPVARGLGSSVTIRLGIMAGLNALLGKPFDKQGLLELVAALEGHPDNAAPAVYGGLAVSGMVLNGLSRLSPEALAKGEAGSKGVVTIHRKLPATLKFVATIPDFEVQTSKARCLLPKQVPFADAVHNVNRVALLVAALWNGNYREIGDFLDDRLHQPSRAKLVPQLFPALDAAKRAGAIGGWLSGSGSTIMALTLVNAAGVGRAMLRMFKKDRVACEIRVMGVDNKGFCCH